MELMPKTACAFLDVMYKISLLLATATEVEILFVANRNTNIINNIINLLLATEVWGNTDPTLLPLRGSRAVRRGCATLSLLAQSLLSYRFLFLPVYTLITLNQSVQGSGVFLLSSLLSLQKYNLDSRNPQGTP